VHVVRVRGSGERGGGVVVGVGEVSGVVAGKLFNCLLRQYLKSSIV